MTIIVSDIHVNLWTLISWNNYYDQTPEFTATLYSHDNSFWMLIQSCTGRSILKSAFEAFQSICIHCQAGCTK